MGQAALKLEQPFTYSDYVIWETEERYELINGEPVLMAPAPNQRHQILAGNLFSELREVLRKSKSPCRAFIAPFDVVLPLPGQKENNSTNVVQPDVLVVCDAKKLTGRNCTGAPDLIVEVLSPSTAIKDQKQKFELYQGSGVREYWIAEPEAGYIIRYVLDSKGEYNREGVYGAQDSIALFFAEQSLDLSLVFEEENTKI